MKVDTLKKELTQMNESELGEKLNQARRELFGLKLSTSTMHVKDYSSFKKLRKNIARILTVLRSRHHKD